MKIVITGAAGFVGQNLTRVLDKKNTIIAIDKHSSNLQLLKELNPTILTVNADLSINGDWENGFENADCIIQLNSQIASKNSEDFIKNNVTATKNIISSMKKFNVKRIIHVSSSVVESVANDDYTNTKKEAELLVKNSSLDYTVLRPTLMFGCFDYKHLWWLSKFLDKSPIFPVPGDGKYVRQPLYVVDFCKIIINCFNNKQHIEKVYDISGKEKIYYVDLMKLIARKKGIRRLFVNMPTSIFGAILDFYGLFTKKPIFTSDQMRALINADEFKLIDCEKSFGIKLTSLNKAWEEIIMSPNYNLALRKAY